MLGRVEEGVDPSGNFVSTWIDCETVLGVPMDMLVAGYGGGSVENSLRLFTARASEDFDMQIFNDRRLHHAPCGRKASNRKLSRRVLYPIEQPEPGKELAAACRSISSWRAPSATFLRRFGHNRPSHRQTAGLDCGHADERHAPGAGRRGTDAHVWWMRSGWRGTRPGISRRRSLAYTNHTLLPEALEQWPV